MSTENMTIGQLIVKLKSLEGDVISNGKQPIVGWTCGYFPEEILMAFGFIPYRVRGIPIAANQASSLIPGNVSPHVLSYLEAAIQGKYSFLRGIVIANTSDAMRRLYDVWQLYLDTPFVCILDVPKVINEKSERYFLSNFLRIIEATEKHFGLKFSEESLREAISACNETRELLRQLGVINRKNSSLLTNYTLSEITNLSTCTPKKEFNRCVRNFINNFDNAILEEKNMCPNILIAGSFYDQNELSNIIEKLGAKVVYEDICTKGKYYESKVSIVDSPLAALAKHYLSKPMCARMIDSERRFNYLLDIINRYNVDAVVYYALKFDDPCLLEFPLLKEWLTDKGIPVLFLEGDCRFGNLGQMETRIQAFLETLMLMRRKV